MHPSAIHRLNKLCNPGITQHNLFCFLSPSSSLLGIHHLTMAVIRFLPEPVLNKLIEYRESTRQTAPGPPPEFRPFNRLPIELRCMVYKLATPRRVFIFGPPAVKIYDAFHISMRVFVNIEPAIAGANKEAWAYVERFRETFRQTAMFYGRHGQQVPQTLPHLTRSHRIQKDHDMLLLNALPVEQSRLNLPLALQGQFIAHYPQRATHMNTFLEHCKHYKAKPCLDIYLFFPDEACCIVGHSCAQYHFQPEAELLRLGEGYPEYQVAIHQYRLALPHNNPQARAEFLELIHDSPMIDLHDMGMLLRWLSFLFVWYGPDNGLFYILGPWWYSGQSWAGRWQGYLAKIFRLQIEKIWVWCCAKRDGRLHDQTIWNRPPPGHDTYATPFPAYLPTPGRSFFKDLRYKWPDPNQDWVNQQLAAMPRFRPTVLVQLCRW